MKTKKVRPVLVEIKDASNIFENNDKTLSFYEHKQHASSGGKKFELILISLEDEKIEEGEYLNLAHRVIVQPTDLEWANSNSNNLKKVIARQSQISPEYISKFIEQYNRGSVEDLEIEMEKCWINSDNVKGNSFTEVAKFEPSINDFDAVLIIQPKLTNGFVTIVEKDSCNKCKNTCKKTSTITNEFGSCTEFNKESITYTEEECLKYCLKALEIGFDLNNTTLPRLYEKSVKQYFIDWFEQNKKK